jgi:chromate reductase
VVEYEMKSVAVLVGSLRRESFNRRFAQALGRLAADRLDFRFVEIGDLPLYNEDLWSAEPPAPVMRMKGEVEACDAVLFVTPEYNRYFSPAIKNAIDWGTRPWGRNSWEAKPAAVTGASPGTLGSAAAQSTLKGLLVVCDMVVMGQPEVYFAYKPELFDAEGEFADDKTRALLNGWADRFAGWIDRCSEPRTSAQAGPA